MLAGNAQLCLSATDNWEIARVEFLLDANLIGTDSTASVDGYCTQLKLESLTDGAHQLKFDVYDSSENLISKIQSINVQLAVPDVPLIKSPQTGCEPTKPLLRLAELGSQ